MFRYQRKELSFMIREHLDENCLVIHLINSCAYVYETCFGELIMFVWNYGCKHVELYWINCLYGMLIQTYFIGLVC